MRKLLVSCGLLLSACATTGGAGGGKSSNAPFPGPEVAKQHREEISNAGNKALDCMKGKEVGGAGGIFAVTAEPSGKLTAEKVKWDGSAEVAQCVMDYAAKTTVSPLPGAPMGVMWTFWAPGKDPGVAQLPGDTGVRIQSMQADAQAQVDQCAKDNLGQDFYAEIEVTVFVDEHAKPWLPTILRSTGKDGGFDNCVLNVMKGLKYPDLGVSNPAPLSLTFKVGANGGIK